VDLAGTRAGWQRCVQTAGHTSCRWACCGRDGAFYFNASPGTRKAKNLARNPQCVITVATHDFDLVIEGEARKVDDEAKIQRIAEAYTAAGWQPTVRDGALYTEYSAPSAGPPPWPAYEVKPTTIFAPGHGRTVRRNPLALLL
jgi:nitroimidazol reductase NimA-like FMN-containing flavoprotein (pyridoxamine 5'-phosphate oxidase superfamily)